MGNSNSTPWDHDLPTGQPTNRYWLHRRSEPTWLLREALLNGDKQVVCGLLGIQVEKPGFFERLAMPLKKRNEEDKIRSSKVLKDLDLTSHRWTDDRGQTGLRTNFPVVGVHSALTKPANESVEERIEILQLLISEKRLDPMIALLKNEMVDGVGGVTPLQLAAKLGSLSVMVEALAQMSAQTKQLVLHAQSEESGGTALHYAVAQHDAQLRLRLLRELVDLSSTEGLGAFLAVEDVSGNTALSAAVVGGALEAARFLLDFATVRGLFTFDTADTQSRLSAMFQLVGDGGLGGSGFSVGDRVRVRSTGKEGVVVGVGRKVKVAQDGAKAGASVEVEAGDAEVVGQREASGGWGWGLAKQVRVVGSDQERVGLLQQKEGTLAARLKIPLAEAAALLQECGYQVDKAQQNHAARPAPAAPAASGAAGPPGDADCTCMICFDEVSPAERSNSAAASTLPCAHFTCDECMAGHARVRIMDEGRLSLLVCPREACRTAIPFQAVERLFRAAPEVSERYRMLQAKGSVDESETAWWCPGLGCGRSVEVTLQAKSYAVTVTCECGTRFCTGCQKPPHEPAPCKMWEAFDEEVSQFERSGEAESEAWVRINTTRCQSCRAPVNRSTGCNHMTCTQCRKEFCYACGAEWHPRHYGCARPEAPDEPRTGPSAVDVSDPKAVNRAFCLKAYQHWNSVITDREEGWYEGMCGQMGFRTASGLLATLHATMLQASRVMACSFAIDFSLPPTLPYARARKTLRELRGGLEGALYPVVQTLQLQRGGTGADQLDKVLLCYLVETDAAVAEELAAVAVLLKRRAARLVSASRAGLMTCPLGTVESLGAALSDGAQQAQVSTSRALRAVAIVLGIAEGPKNLKARAARSEPEGAQV